MKLFISSLLACLLVVCVSAGPRIIAQKVVLNDYIVEGKDLTVKYFLVNIGTE